MRQRRVFQEMRVGGELRAGGSKVPERGEFRFADEAAGEHARIGRCRQRESAIMDCQPDIIDTHGKVKKPRGPELPTPPAPEHGSDTAANTWVSELSRNSHCDYKDDDEQHGRPTARIPASEPAQQVGPEKSRQQE